MNCEVITNFQELLADTRTTLAEGIIGKRAFKNSKKLNLLTCLTLIMSPLNRSLQIELFDHYQKMGKLEEMPTKSAFSQSRKHIYPEVFKNLNQRIKVIETFEKLKNPKKKKPIRHYPKPKWLAIDGTTFTLPDVKTIKKAFGSIVNQYGSTPMARGCICLDIDSWKIEHADIDNINISEKAIALRWFDNFEKGTVLVADRYYVGYAYFYQHQKRGLDYLVRLRKNWNNQTKEFIASGADQALVTIKIPEKALTTLRKEGEKITGKHTMTLRLIKMLDDNGEPVYYATSLLDNQRFTKEYLHARYHKRWNVETGIDALKNKYQIECFSGHSPLVIEQDFHATICYYNFIRLIYNQADHILQQNENAKKKTAKKEGKKYVQKQINHNLAIGLISINFPMLANKKKGWKKTFEFIIDLLVRSPEPVRPNRSFKRKKRKLKGRGKYLTLTNYRKAN